MAVRVEPAAPRLLPLLHLATLVLILGNELISFTIGRGAGSDGSFLLLSGLAKHGAETLNFELQLAAVVVVLSDGLGDLVVSLFELIELVAGLVKSHEVSKIVFLLSKGLKCLTLTWSRASVVVRISAWRRANFSLSPLSSPWR